MQNIFIYLIFVIYGEFFSPTYYARSSKKLYFLFIFYFDEIQRQIRYYLQTISVRLKSKTSFRLHKIYRKNNITYIYYIYFTLVTVNA